MKVLRRQNDWTVVVFDMSWQPLIWFAKKGMLGRASALTRRQAIVGFGACDRWPRCLHGDGPATGAAARPRSLGGHRQELGRQTEMTAIHPLVCAIGEGLPPLPRPHRRPYPRWFAPILACPKKLMGFCRVRLGYRDVSQPINQLVIQRAPLAAIVAMRNLPTLRSHRCKASHRPPPHGIIRRPRR